MTSHPHELTPKDMRREVDTAHFGFTTTQELKPVREIIGQPRGIRAIEFGIGIDSPGFNIYVLGPTGSGRTTAITQFLEERAESGRVPCDWVYVYNFEVMHQHQPRAIELASGMGGQFRDDMDSLISVLRREIPNALAAEEFAQAAEHLENEFTERRGEVFNEISGVAKEKGFTIVRTPSGLVIAPLDENGQVMEPDAYQALPPEKHDPMEEQRMALEEELERALRRVRDLDREHTDSRNKLERGAAAFVLVQHLGDLREKYQDSDEILLYLNQVRDDILERLHDFRPTEESSDESAGAAMMGPVMPEEDSWQRYKVNLIIDHSKSKGAPVILEDFPSYSNLVGRIEGSVQMGALQMDFMGIKAGALHKANGGYLVLRARDVLTQPDAWDGLKRALLSHQIRIEESGLRTGMGVLTPQTIEPEPIPLDIKVVLLGDPGLYYALYAGDENFSDLFKVKSDFASIMPRDDASEIDYAEFIAARCHERDLPHFSREAVAAVIEQGSRMAGDQTKLSTLFGELTDLIHEAAYWAQCDNAQTVEARHVTQALDEARYRANLIQERTLEQIERQVILIDTVGEVVGQVNALSIIGLGDYEFAQPSRITARVYMGKEGIINIEREAEMSGPIHSKGVLTLRGYLGGKYAPRQQLALTASITFEQTYSGVDGDSASAAELFALLSALSGYPIRQNIAVTGSVNQLGHMQPIGGVNEKIEGFFAVCKARGLTGDQGVIIPRTNVCHLMVRRDVIDAVEAGRFHIYAVDDMDQGIELLTGVPAGERDGGGNYPEGTVHHAVQREVNSLSEAYRQWSRIDI